MKGSAKNRYGQIKMNYGKLCQKGRTSINWKKSSSDLGSAVLGIFLQN
jgi:hypothetical protein